jgi:hypothetical protein
MEDGILKDELNIHAAWIPVTNIGRVVKASMLQECRNFLRHAGYVHT